MARKKAPHIKPGRKKPKRRPSPRRETMGELLARVQGDLNALTPAQIHSAKRFQSLQAQIKSEIRAALGDKYSYPRTELAQIFGCAERTITRWSKQGRIPQSQAGKWDIRQVVLVRRDQAEGNASHLTPQERRDLASARIAELKLGRELGELITRDAVERMVGPVLSTVRTTLLGAPERLLRYIPIAQRPDARAELESAAHAALKELQEAFKNAAK